MVASRGGCDNYSELHQKRWYWSLVSGMPDTMAVKGGKTTTEIVVCITMQSLYRYNSTIKGGEKTSFAQNEIRTIFSRSNNMP